MNKLAMNCGDSPKTAPGCFEVVFRPHQYAEHESSRPHGIPRRHSKLNRLSKTLCRDSDAKYTAFSFHTMGKIVACKIFAVR